MKKRGFTEVQFTWIFILIAGAVFLLIFAKITGKQRDISEEKVSAITLRGLSSVFTSLSISSNAFHEGELPKQSIKVSCDKFTIAGQSMPFGNSIIFSPALIKGEKYLSMTLQWNVPFKVTNFVYLTHPEVRYIFVENGLDIVYTNVLSKIPDKMKYPEGIIEVGNTEVDKDKNNYKVRFIYFGENSNPTTNPNNIILPNTKDYDITKLEVLSDKINFYRKNKNNWDDIGGSSYLDDEMLLGAIFSEDKETYECVVGRAFELLRKEAGFNEKVVTKLRDAIVDPCKTIYNEALVQFTIILQNLAISSSSFLKSAMSELDKLNADAEKNSCITLY